jgi:hypothetical protein
MNALKANEVTEPGAYEWYDENGRRHVGFLRQERRGNIAGSFISEEGATRAVAMRYGDGTFCEGMFFGPLPVAEKL